MLRTSDAKSSGCRAVTGGRRRSGRAFHEVDVVPCSVYRLRREVHHVLAVVERAGGWPCGGDPLPQVPRADFPRREAVAGAGRPRGCCGAERSTFAGGGRLGAVGVPRGADEHEGGAHPHHKSPQRAAPCERRVEDPGHAESAGHERCPESACSASRERRAKGACHERGPESARSRERRAKGACHERGPESARSREQRAKGACHERDPESACSASRERRAKGDRNECDERVP